MSRGVGQPPPGGVVLPIDRDQSACFRVPVRYEMALGVSAGDEPVHTPVI